MPVFPTQCIRITTSKTTSGVALWIEMDVTITQGFSLRSRSKPWQSTLWHRKEVKVLVLFFSCRLHLILKDFAGSLTSPLWSAELKLSQENSIQRLTVSLSYPFSHTVSLPNFTFSILQTHVPISTALPFLQLRREEGTH